MEHFINLQNLDREGDLETATGFIDHLISQYSLDSMSVFSFKEDNLLLNYLMDKYSISKSNIYVNNSIDSDKFTCPSSQAEKWPFYFAISIGDGYMIYRYNHIGGFSNDIENAKKVRIILNEIKTRYF